MPGPPSATRVCNVEASARKSRTTISESVSGRSSARMKAVFSSISYFAAITRRRCPDDWKTTSKLNSIFISYDHEKWGQLWGFRRRLFCWYASDVWLLSSAFRHTWPAAWSPGKRYITRNHLIARGRLDATKQGVDLSQDTSETLLAIFQSNGVCLVSKFSTKVGRGLAHSEPREWFTSPQSMESKSYKPFGYDDDRVDGIQG
ncbi:hypothetical protein EJ05DRAFT_498870 [Pseudovirgaria hyperparasitica]|uniref:Uncharacterized protein n=1 Tax=Pseudovirgaria hyperparasitica TaxID=470096 RepID=A0A6A6WAS2_9PEZI|nr:uncharacterized protein EJ05DRAFT_498870 [Pseudovirgaria hyperparasitica]KAF2759665.1 hypothetical protein EJ05DRAFT_498870 [Pseudovirgaria hyperparasitica]